MENETGSKKLFDLIKNLESHRQLISFFKENDSTWNFKKMEKQTRTLKMRIARELTVVKNRSVHWSEVTPFWGSSPVEHPIMESTDDE